MLPLQLGTTEEFSLVRSFLQRSEYTFASISKVLGVNVEYDFTQVRSDPDPSDPKDAVELLVRLFLKGEFLTSAQVARFVPVEVQAAMQRLGLLSVSTTGDQFFAPSVLYEMRSVYLVSDRWSAPGGGDFQIPSDAVYPAMTASTQRFLDSLSAEPCERLLDLGTGCGVAALAMAKGCASHAWATDIASRSVQCTEFNRRLNGLTNVTAAEGDLYGAVPNQSFDRIVAHPPYVPVLKAKWIYHDGGTDGEEITRRIVEGLPRALRPGGTFQAYAMGTDREQPWEDRLRNWLGDAQKEFDLLVVVVSEASPAGFAAETALKEGSAEDFEVWKQRFEEWKVQRLVYGSITIQRHREECIPLTFRRSRGAFSGAEEAMWLMRWERVANSAKIADLVLDACPVASPYLQLAALHRVEERELKLATCKAAVAYPYEIDIEVPGWLPMLLVACDGRTRGMEIFERMRQEGAVPLQVLPEQFAAMLASLVSRGFAYFKEYAPPALRATAAGAGV
jgi:hypothetical protein